MMRDLPPELRHVVESMEATKVGLLPKTYSKLRRPHRTPLAASTIA
jgi:hypothetical protein